MIRTYDPELLELEEELGGQLHDQQLRYQFLHEFESPETADYFVVRLGRTPEGHERLTRDAATGFPGISASDLTALIAGVRRVDVGKGPMDFIPAMTNQFKASQQRRHALRKELCQPLSSALIEFRQHLALLHAKALSAILRGYRRQALEWVGEALHLIQDSYSPAHVERLWRGSGGRHPIVYIRYFGLRGRPYPLEHRVFPPPDPRDIVTGTGGLLTRAARQAVSASREYLHLVLRHFSTPRSPRISAQLHAFMNKHLVLSPRRIEPRHYYPRCP